MKDANLLYILRIAAFEIFCSLPFWKKHSWHHEGCAKMLITNMNVPGGFFLSHCLDSSFVHKKVSGHPALLTYCTTLQLPQLHDSKLQLVVRVLHNNMMSISSMLMSLTWGEGPDHFTSSAESRQWVRALISCYCLAFTGSLRQSIQLLHITAEDELRGIKKKKKQKGRERKNRNDWVLLTLPYLDLLICPCAPEPTTFHP